jgi:hypothetical protein
MININKESNLYIDYCRTKNALKEHIKRTHTVDQDLNAGYTRDLRNTRFLLEGNSETQFFMWQQTVQL